MRSLPLYVVILTLLTGTAARAEENVDYGRDLTTFQGTLGSDPIIMELAYPKQNDTIVGRYTLPEIGKDIPLHSANTTSGQPGPGDTITLVEEAPCTPKNCQSIVPERDDEFLDLAPGKAPKAATWTLTVKEDGNTISGVRKDISTGEKRNVTLTSERTITLTDDCCTTYDLLLSGDNAIQENREKSYDTLRYNIEFENGPATSLNEGRYHMEIDSRIGAEFPVLDALPGNGDVTKANEWLFEARIDLFERDYVCASRSYHGFRWNKAMAKKLKNYTTHSKASVDFLSGKLIGIGQNIEIDCGDSWPENARKFILADVKTGKTVNVKTLLSGFEYQDYEGKPTLVTDPYGEYVPTQDLIDQMSAAFSETDYGTCLDENTRKKLTVAFRGDSLAFTFEDMPPGSDCYDDILTIPLAEAGDYLNDQGKAYFAEYLKQH